MAGRQPYFSVLIVLIAAFMSVGHAATPPSLVYWQRVLPKTPIPSAIRERLNPSTATVDGGKGRVGPPVDGNFVIYHTVGEPNFNPNTARGVYFFEKDLHSGTKFSTSFPKAEPGPSFLPRHAADAMPFSSSKLPEILHRFSVEPNSEDAQLMKRTIRECESPAIEGEAKYCATSLESMVDFATPELGTPLAALAAAEAENEKRPKQAYTVAPEGLKKVANDRTLACHAQAYVYAVYYCHALSNTSAYTVPLVGEDGRTRIRAVAICHADTLHWNPRHVAFQQLKVKPGSGPICHFANAGSVTWVRK